MSEAVRDLYQEVIMEHNKSPRNKGVLESANRKADGQNPLCGDEIQITAKVDGGKVTDLRFSGHGCAISQASASLMTAAVKGRTVEDAARLFEHFHHLVTREGGPADPVVLGKLKVFAGVGEFPARVKCATLAWHTLKAALEGGGTVSTE